MQFIRDAHQVVEIARREVFGGADLTPPELRLAWQEAKEEFGQFHGCERGPVPFTKFANLNLYLD